MPARDGIRPPRAMNPRTDTSSQDALAETYVKPDYTHKPMNVARDENNNVVYVDEEVPLTREELLALRKKTKLSAVQRKQLETGVRIQRATVFEAEEDVELRAARIKF